MLQSATIYIQCFYPHWALAASIICPCYLLVNKFSYITPNFKLGTLNKWSKSILWIDVSWSANNISRYMSEGVTAENFWQPKICYFGFSLVIEKDVGCLHISVDYGWRASFMKILQACNSNLVPNNKLQRRVKSSRYQVVMPFYKPWAASSAMRSRSIQCKAPGLLVLPEREREN